MTNLLATLLTGWTNSVTQGSRIKAGTGQDNPSGPGFEEVLHEKTGGAPESPPESVAEAGKENEASGKRPNTDDKGGATDSTGRERAGLKEGSTAGVTLLGGSLGPRARVPALTFMLPNGASPEDMAAAIRTQVLRFTAAGNLDPGSLDNLRIGISSRELGQVEVDLSAQGEKLTVEIVASGREAESVLRKTSGDLKEGILARTDRFRQVDVKVATRGTQGEEEPGRNPRQGSERDTNQNSRQESDRGADSNPETGPESTEDPS